MIDTHCHIDDPQYAEDLAAFLADQQASGVEVILVPGVDKTSVKDVLEVCNKYPKYLFPALGLHPENVKEDWQEQLQVLKAAVDARMCSAPLNSLPFREGMGVGSPRFLFGSALFGCETCVVEIGGEAFLLEVSCEFLCALAVADIHDG